ncbi:Uncharacterized protein FKW44_000764 [Caligus rogercresseyi]|uniref:Uncharacterized protein n=1 Tax=Caligus rogercresseyi TaxID=217165 RepID=A0A7T8QV42_CALRO|nr:Uncharacterized protein FKW44_000764 [Caligus rogercresseyi]
MNPPDQEPSTSISNGQMGVIGASKGGGGGIKPRPRKAPELPSMERRNWLIHMHYVRKEFDLCKSIIVSQLERNRGQLPVCTFHQWTHSTPRGTDTRVSGML